MKFKSDLRRDDPTLNGIAGAGTGENIDFTSRLKLMLNWMDNPAARGIQRDLGFQCVNALLEDGGFFDARYGGGLWLSKLYGVNEVWGGGDPVSGKSVQGATARAVAEMMILIGRHKLIRLGLSGEILPLMSSNAGSHLGPGGWFLNAVENATDPEAPVVPGAAPPKRSLDSWLSVFSGFGSRFNECVLIRRPDPFGRFLQYAAVILNAPNSTVIEQVAVKLDDCIRSKYPPPPPPPPPPSPTTA